MDRTVNNKHQTSPAIMCDGRSFTDYRPSCYVDTMIANANRIQGSNQYREFLMKNGLQLMKVNDKYVEEKLSHRMCNNNEKPNSNFVKDCLVGSNTTTCLDSNPSGLGVYYHTEGNNMVSGFDKTDSKFQTF